MKLSDEEIAFLKRFVAQKNAERTNLIELMKRYDAKPWYKKLFTPYWNNPYITK